MKMLAKTEKHHCIKGAPGEIEVCLSRADSMHLSLGSEYGY